MNPSELIIILADDDPDDQLFLRDAFKTVRPEVTVELFENGKKVMSRLSIFRKNPAWLGSMPQSPL